MKIGTTKTGVIVILTDEDLARMQATNNWEEVRRALLDGAREVADVGPDTPVECCHQDSPRAREILSAGPPTL